MQDFKDKTAVITGGATGIGFALAKALGAEGARIIIAEPREEVLQESVSKLTDLGIDAKCQVCDVTQIEQVEALADFAWRENGSVELVFSNAGIGIGQIPIVDTSKDDLHRVFDVNFFGVWYCNQVFGKRLIEQGTPAAMFNTGSENALFNAVPNNAAYVATKHAVLGLTDSLREQMPDYIQVGLIIPGWVGTEMIPPAIRSMAMDPDRYAAIVMEQIKADTFYIVSHAFNIEHIDRRHQEISEAFQTYAPRYDGDAEYDIRTLLAARADTTD